MTSQISRWAHVEIISVLLLILAASSATFWVLVRRWTTRRQRVALGEWGRQSGFKFVRDAQRLPPVLEVLEGRDCQVEAHLGDAKTRLLRVRTLWPSRPSHGTGTLEVHWNILVRRLEDRWNPAGIRPSATARSILDFFSLSGFPTIGGVDRFVLFAADSEAAAQFPESTARALLPPDLGLLLHGDALILDFSDRPFDDLEFDRTIALAEQLALKLARRPA